MEQNNIPTVDELYPQGYTVVQNNDGRPDTIVPHPLSDEEKGKLIANSTCTIHTQLMSIEEIAEKYGTDEQIEQIRKIWGDWENVMKNLNDTDKASAMQLGKIDYEQRDRETPWKEQQHRHTEQYRCWRRTN